jgi:hypothetical protein
VYYLPLLLNSIKLLCCCCIGHASADTQRDRGSSIRLYEMNIWMWRYGRGRSRVLSIAEAERNRLDEVTRFHRLSRCTAVKY